MQRNLQIDNTGGPSWPGTMTDGTGAVEMVGQVGNAVTGDSEMAGVGSIGVGGGNLLGTVWKFTGAAHWLTTRNPLTGAFQSMLVGSLNEALKRASQLAQSGYDVYLSPAEFQARAQTRKAQDVACVRGFWIDVDVGASKAEQGLGYATLQEAMATVKAFHLAAGLPHPTHVVCSGGGLHVYWVVGAPMEPTQWLASAKLLKTLTKSLGLLADPTRTADIASLLRVPDTFNFKDKANPRAVKLIYSSAALIEQSVMIKAIEAAHVHHCGAVTLQTPALCKMPVPQRYASGVLPKQWVMVPTELAKLTSALSTLSPDVEESIWTLRRLAPMARAARDCPDHHDQLYALARSWSSGELGGVESRAWITPGNNGRTGEQHIDAVWNRFVAEKCCGRPITTLSSIYLDAQTAGWVAPEDRLEAGDDTVEVTE